MCGWDPNAIVGKSKGGNTGPMDINTPVGVYGWDPMGKYGII